MSDVRLEGLRKSYGDVAAIKDVTLQVHEGELVTLLGPSGCGKTTTLRMVAGLLEPDEGQIYVGGVPMRGVPPYRRDVGMVFQNGAVFPHMSVLENVEYGLRMRRVTKENRRARAEEMLELVGLARMENRKPRELSGGQQQRVALARALVIHPKVLLLDEPLSALDLALRQRLRTEIRQIQQKLGITAIFVTHDQVEALSISDRIAVMNLGVVEQVGTPAEIYGGPSTSFVAGFLGEANRLEGRVLRVDDEQTLVRTAAGLEITVRNSGRPAVAGVSALVLIRPEALRLEPDGASPTGREGVVGEVYLRSFLGSSVRYHVALSDELRMFADVDAEHGPTFAIGDRVGVRCLGSGTFGFPIG